MEQAGNEGLPERGRIVATTAVLDLFECVFLALTLEVGLVLLCGGELVGGVGLAVAGVGKFAVGDVEAVLGVGGVLAGGGGLVEALLRLVPAIGRVVDALVSVAFRCGRTAGATGGGGEFFTGGSAIAAGAEARGR